MNNNINKKIENIDKRLIRVETANKIIGVLTTATFLAVILK